MLLITAGYQLHSGFLWVIWETDTALVDTDYLKLQRSFFNVAKYYTIGAFSQKKKKNLTARRHAPNVLIITIKHDFPLQY